VRYVAADVLSAIKSRFIGVFNKERDYFQSTHQRHAFCFKIPFCESLNLYPLKPLDKEQKSKAKSSSRTPTTPEKKPTMSELAFKHFAGAQTEFKPPLIANENAYLGDIATSEPLDPTSPISAGFYRLEKGTPLVYEYTYHEMKIIVDGEFDIEDQTGQKVHAVKGDVFYFPKGSKITFTTETFGLGFFVGQRKEGAA